MQTLDRATPESLGIPSTAILAWVDALERIAPDFHSLMIVRHGRVAAEGWWAPNGPDLPHLLYSLSKSFTSTAVGLAIAEGHFGLDDRVVSFFPDRAPAEVSPDLAAMTVRHLLAMCTGHAEEAVNGPLPPLDTDLAASFLALPIAYPPGSRFVYNTPASYMLSAIVQRRTGLNLVDYLEPRLFGPLGIERPAWLADSQGIAMGGFGLRLRTEDIARFGQLYLQQGAWGSRQLVPADWVAAATSFQMDNAPSLNPSPDWVQGYGYQFWRGRHDSFRGDGAFGQFCLVVPEAELVVAITAGIDPMQSVLDAVWDVLLPSLAPAALAEDAAGLAALTARLKALRLTPGAGAAASPLESDLDGAEFAVEPNDLGLASLRLEFGPDGGSLVADGPKGLPHRLEFGRGAWRQGTSDLMTEWGGQPLVASGAWPRPDCLELDVCLHTDAYRYRLAFDFSGPDLRVAVSANVSFGPTDLGSVVARRVPAQR